MNKRLKVSTVVFVSLSASASLIHAADLDYKIEPFVDVTYGIFNSQKSYANPEDGSKKTWQELSAQYGVKGTLELSQASVYGSLIGVSSATFGDGDAADNTNGHERKTNIGEWTLGVKDTHGKEAYSKYDFSVGRQNVVIGDGFFVAGDALNLGEPPADGQLNRGGAYYLAARKSFDFTTVLKFRPWEQLSTEFAYLKSNNKAQFSPELFVTDLKYQQDKIGVGFTYLDVLSLDDEEHVSDRQNLKNYALHFNYNVNPALEFKSEYVIQDQANATEHAGYLGLSYNFSDLAYKPSVGYRYSRFSEHYDPMFYGNTVGFGTWFQGEVAGNYAGPFNSNANIHQISLSMSPRENLMFGALAYKFDSLKKQPIDLNAFEIDIYSVWSVNKNINIIPLFGFYKPKHDLSDGGNQMPNNKLNTYSQLLLQYTY